MVAWSSWRKLTRVLYTTRRLDSLRLELNVYEATIRPALTYGSECWAMKVECWVMKVECWAMKIECWATKGNNKREIATAEMRMLRGILGVLRRDHIICMHILPPWTPQYPHVFYWDSIVGLLNECHSNVLLSLYVFLSPASAWIKYQLYPPCRYETIYLISFHFLFESVIDNSIIVAITTPLITAKGKKVVFFI